jgi:hypothetical protein
MRRTVLFLMAGLLALPLYSQKAAKAETVTVEQLTALLTADAANGDAEIANELGGLQLSERLSTGRFARLNAGLPGEKSKLALTILADSAALLAPSEAETVPNPRPDAAALRQMLAQVVNYTNTTLRQLPNFVATRSTTAFEDRPKEDVLQSTGIISFSYLPLHRIASASSEVTYRDGHEAVETPQKVAHGTRIHGLVTAGEFGPFLATVLADALRGKITWSRWEQGVDGVDAVFHYEVTEPASHYSVQFCCTQEDVNEQVASHIYRQQAGYHGEISFNPTTGAVLRVDVEAVLTPGELVDKAAMVVEYAPTEVAGRTVILPVKSMSLLAAHTTAPPAGMHMAQPSGPAKTFLNDVTFENYHQFRGEMRILTGENVEPTTAKP